MADKLIVEPKSVFVSRRFQAGPRWAAQEADAGGSLEDVRGKWTAISVEFNAQISGIGDPGDLIAGIENDDLRDESNEYGAFGHLVS